MPTFRSKLLLGVAAALALSSTAAQAAITLSAFDGPDPGAPSGYTTVLNYDGLDTGFFTQSGNFGVSSVDIPNITATPLGQAPGNNFAYVTNGNEYTLTAPVITGFSVYMGSIDYLNSIAFYNGAVSLGAFGGVALAGPGAGDGITNAVANNRRLVFNFNGAVADRIVFSTPGKNSFEFDTLAVPSAVPEPATWAMMITGFGLMGAVLRRRRHLGAAAA